MSDPKLSPDMLHTALVIRDMRRGFCDLAEALGWPREDWTMERIVDEVKRIRSELAAQGARLKEAEAIVAPFSEAADSHDSVMGCWRASPDDADVGSGIAVGDLRRAREWLRK